MVNIYFLTYVTYFAYAHYYLLSVYLLQGEQTVCWQTFRSHPFCLCLCLSIAGCANSLTLLANVRLNQPLCWRSSLLADDIASDVNSPGISHFHISSLVVNIYISPILFMPITSFYMSVFCRVRWLSHTLGKTFSKVELSVEVHHP